MGCHARASARPRPDSGRKRETGKESAPPHRPHRACPCWLPKMNPYSGNPNLAETLADLASFHATHLRSVHSLSSVPFPFASVELCWVETVERGGRTRTTPTTNSRCRSILVRSLAQSLAVFHQVFMAGYDSQIQNPAGRRRPRPSHSPSLPEPRAARPS